jgi:hypothetical protein
MPTDRNLGTRIARDIRDELRMAQRKRNATRTPPLLAEGNDRRRKDNHFAQLMKESDIQMSDIRHQAI